MIIVVSVVGGLYALTILSLLAAIADRLLTIANALWHREATREQEAQRTISDPDRR